LGEQQIEVTVRTVIILAAVAATTGYVCACKPMASTRVARLYSRSFRTPA